jgi:hypothetical protein
MCLLGMVDHKNHGTTSSLPPCLLSNFRPVDPAESDIDVVEERIEQTRVEWISDRDEFLKVFRPFWLGEAESVSLDGGSGGSRPLPSKDPVANTWSQGCGPA